MAQRNAVLISKVVFVDGSEHLSRLGLVTGQLLRPLRPTVLDVLLVKRLLA